MTCSTDQLQVPLPPPSPTAGLTRNSDSHASVLHRSVKLPAYRIPSEPNMQCPSASRIGFSHHHPSHRKVSSGTRISHYVPSRRCDHQLKLDATLMMEGRPPHRCRRRAKEESPPPPPPALLSLRDPGNLDKAALMGGGWVLARLHPDARPNKTAAPTQQELGLLAGCRRVVWRSDCTLVPIHSFVHTEGALKLFRRPNGTAREGGRPGRGRCQPRPLSLPPRRHGPVHDKLRP